jgi:predicted RND superfamily exporter protein
MALAVAGVLRLELETDILATLPPDLPEAQGLRLLRDAFRGGDELLLAVEMAGPRTGTDLSEEGGAPPETGAAEAAASLGETLKQQTGLVREVQWAGTLENPATAGALLAWALRNAPPDRIAPLVERLTGPGAVLTAHLEEVLERLASSPDPAEVQRWSYDPLGLLEVVDMAKMSGWDESGFSMASADGTLRLLLVAPREKLSGYKEAAAWLEKIRAVEQTWLAGRPDRGGIKLYHSGEPAFMAETGSGIEKDLRGTIGIATLLIAALFWAMFRRWRVLILIQVLLALVVFLTLALGGWVLGTLSIMSIGFASILLGIAVDYAVFILQEGVDHPERSAAGLRRAALPPILGGACTTSTVFLALLFSGLPGLADMGLMVALGVGAGFVVMVGLMPEIVVRSRVRPVPLPVKEPHPGRSRRLGLAVTVGAVCLIAGVLGVKGFPAFQSSSAVLRPSGSQAMAAWEHFQEKLGRPDRAALPLLATAPRWQDLATAVAPAEKVLAEAAGEGLVLSHSLPAALLPDETAQLANEPPLTRLRKALAQIEAAVLDAGFNEEALHLSRHTFASLANFPLTGGRSLAMPADPAAAAVLGRFYVSEAPGGGAVLLGSVAVEGTPGNPELSKVAALKSRLQGQAVQLAGWETLGPALSARIQHDLTRLMLPLVLVLAVMLALTFRNVADFLLCGLMLILGIAGLTATMALLGQSWNLANVAALPLLLGLGIDYGIHILLAMKRHHDDVSKVWATTGRAVFFCGATTVIGFSSLIFAGNGGVASLGLACAVGSLWTLFFALGLLPLWRAWLGRGRGRSGKAA